VGLRHYERYGDIAGGNAPNLIVGSIAEEADGPLAFTYGRYAIITQQGDPWQEVTAVAPPTTPPSWPSPMDNMFTVATYNTYNFNGGTTKMTKVVSTVLEMGAPTFVALQEIEVTSVMTDLLNNLAAEGYAYDYAYSHPDVGGRGVALIWRTDQVENVTWSTEYQGCSAVGSGSSTAYDTYCDGTGLLPLFSRRPVVVTATVATADLEVVVIANHFKSKRGGDPADDQRRLEQAQFVAGLVDGFVTEVPDIMVLGDLNDFEDSPPLEALYASETLTNTWYAYNGPRYSYIYEGVSQILDHILISTSLWEYLDDIAPMHYNADFPFNPYSSDPTVIWRSSDHDPVVAAFEHYTIYLPLVVRNYP
jgi:exonuclease III